MNARIVFKNSDTSTIESHDINWYRDFLSSHLRESGLQIGPHLRKIGNRPVFVVAATGVGKTVGVPVHLLIRLYERLRAQSSVQKLAPCVLVVEPTIPICRSEAGHMNSLFQDFLAARGLPANAHPFGVVTGPYKSNVDAPIRFVTTGVFEQMAKAGMDANRFRVVVDEAHRVLAQSPGTEIAACVARTEGVIIDWMSATVDTSEIQDRFDVDLVLANEERYPILKVPTNAPLDQCVGDIAVRCLVRPDGIIPSATEYRGKAEQSRCERARLHLLSPTSFIDPVDNMRYAGLNERPQGMLVVVNSHQGENSDTRRIADRIRAASRAAGADVEVLRLASPVVRDPDQYASFKRRIDGIEKRRGRYVVVTTNVVEMGVTFPSLDFVLTMDTELETTRADRPQERPLGVNAFFQRIGRVGRRRPGMALLTREGNHGAAFSAWSANDLAERLQLEPISFATSRGDLRELAFFLYEHRVASDMKSVRDYVARGRMPSRPELDSQVLRALVAERTAIQAARLSDDGCRLNARGTEFRRIGVVNDLELGSLLIDCIKAGGALPYIGLVTAANPGGLRELIGRRKLLDDEPTLSQTVPFACDQFQKPIAKVVQILRSTTPVVDSKAIGTDDVTAHRLSELLVEGYRADEVRSVERDGRSEDPTLLTLSRETVRLDTSSEILAVYDVVRYFVVKYRADLADQNLADYERERVRAALREEARLLGVDAGRLIGVISRMDEIARRANIDLGVDRPTPPITSESLERLVFQSERFQSKLDADARRREILRVFRSSLGPKPAANLPQPTPEERRRFLRAIDQLGLFIPVELTVSEDDRGNAIFQGTVPHAGGAVTVTIPRGRTSLRLEKRTKVRGRLIELASRDAKEKDNVRYSLSLTSIRE